VKESLIAAGWVICRFSFMISLQICPSLPRSNFAPLVLCGGGAIMVILEFLCFFYFIDLVGTQADGSGNNNTPSSKRKKKSKKSGGGGK
jgi:hypothetical protein